MCSLLNIIDGMMWQTSRQWAMWSLSVDNPWMYPLWVVIYTLKYWRVTPTSILYTGNVHPHFIIAQGPAWVQMLDMANIFSIKGYLTKLDSGQNQTRQSVSDIFKQK